MLRLDDVHVHIGKLHILQGVNLEVKPGECAALLGRNGVGKTTTLRAIMGLAPRTRGAVEFDGIDLTRCPAHEVPQGYRPGARGAASFPNLTVLENLNIGLPASVIPSGSSTCSGCFPLASRNGSSNRAIPSQAASSRCWRSPAA
jgi:branched-chain amino acid transport system ATP-binding protein